jgi:hypothetical protein
MVMTLRTLPPALTLAVVTLFYKRLVSNASGIVSLYRFVKGETGRKFIIFLLFKLTLK